MFQLIYWLLRYIRVWEGFTRDAFAYEVIIGYLLLSSNIMLMTDVTNENWNIEICGGFRTLKYISACDSGQYQIQTHSANGRIGLKWCTDWVIIWYGY